MFREEKQPPSPNGVNGVQDSSFLQRYTQLHGKIQSETEIPKEVWLGGGAPGGRGEEHHSQFANGKFKHTKTDRVSAQSPR